MARCLTGSLFLGRQPVQIRILRAKCETQRERYLMHLFYLMQDDFRPVARSGFAKTASSRKHDALSTKITAPSMKFHT